MGNVLKACAVTLKREERDSFLLLSWAVSGNGDCRKCYPASHQHRSADILISVEDYVTANGITQINIILIFLIL